MLPRFPILLALIALSGTIFGSTLGIYRYWTSADGRTIRAKVVSIDHEAQSAVFKRDDGREFTIYLSQLAKEDASRLSARPKETSQPEVKQKSSTTPAQQDNSNLPTKVELDEVPMIVQKHNYCVPASAAMIAQFHGVDTDQDQISQLSSAASENYQGTYPSDMLRAMQKLGFTGRSLSWESREQFEDEALLHIKRTLFECGPVYVSYRKGVFGNSGHGCVIVGYNDRKQEFTINNPWGNVFTGSYDSLAIDCRGVVLIDPPSEAPVAEASFITTIQRIIPQLDGGILNLPSRLKAGRVSHELIWCSRMDSRKDPRFARDTARGHGRQILELSFERNPAVIIPESDAGRTIAYLFVTRPEEGARFIVRRIDASGWSPPSEWTLGQLTRSWPTKIRDEEGEVIWELPMIELRPKR